MNNGLNGSASSSSLNGGLGHLNGINNLNNLVNLQNQLNYNQPEDWEQVLKLAMLRNNKQMEERNNLLNMMGNGLGKSHGLLGKYFYMHCIFTDCNFQKYKENMSFKKF